MSTISVESAYPIVLNQDFSPVKKRLAEKDGLGDETLEEMAGEYAKFIALCSQHATKESPLAISSAVDPFWHAHILHTRDYANMAKALGLGNLHHEPASSDELTALEPHYRRTIELYTSHFGAPSEKYWPPFAQICGGSGCSCSGTGNE